MNSKFYMPAEYMPHSATIMVWCEREGSWIYNAKYARPIFANIIKEISKGEKVYLVVSNNSKQSAIDYLNDEIVKGAVQLVEIDTDDCWARDISPLFLIDNQGGFKALDFTFNAWGGDFDGLYKDYANDDLFKIKFIEKLNVEKSSIRPFILEGGSIHVDGCGTLITTEECLLSQGRNIDLSREQIENVLKCALGVNKIVWLPYGVIDDETNGHVDNICTFIDTNKVLLAYTDEGEQGVRCRADLKVLLDNGIEVIKCPFPKNNVCFTQFEVDGFVFEEGEIERKAGDVLPASYINYYICNHAVILPQFNDENDDVAYNILKDCFPNREIVRIDAKQLLVGGGNVHCLTMQIPLAKGV